LFCIVITGITGDRTDTKNDSTETGKKSQK